MPEQLLQIDERLQLTQIIADSYDFTDGGARGRRVMIEQAGLRRFLAGIDLSGAPRLVAGALIGKLEAFGYLPERPTYHALGAILNYFLAIGELPRQDATFLAKVIVSYGLVTDPSYLEKLQANYEITDVHAATVPADRASPRPVLKEDLAEPEFEITEQVEAEWEGLERVINSETSFLDIYSLLGAIYSAPAVCRIELPEGTADGTGFLIGPDLLLTNHHVIPDQEAVGEAAARFDYAIDATGVIPQGKLFNFIGDFYYTSDARELDYALLRLQDQPLKEVTLEEEEMADLSFLELVRLGKHRGFLALAPRKVRNRDRVNIIQHPGGDPLKVVMTQNYIIGDMAETRVHYVADTKPGSSGSPVFNELWEVVGLHHSGKPYPSEADGDSPVDARNRRTRTVNEGVPIRAILEDFGRRGLDRYLPA